ncbi:uncharacterized protein LOC133286593 [Gastrolobium bilobum]|uniref:uncharacterized protein LOC133286593 n=1 Tax=Gastrolobium bilobum TaxID=150636 RepID=UPI002AB07017|nr:uncharacterized protein LOC133286593 [Gastrolobium bilobum]
MAVTGGDDGWLTLFFVICWKNWNWRNEMVHGTALPNMIVKKSIIGELVRNIHDAWSHALGNMPQKISMQIDVAWQFPIELWGVLRGLELTWREGYRNIIIESDSSSVITVLTMNGEAVRECHLIARIRTWLNRSWSVNLMHTYREGNVCVNWMTNSILDLEDHIPFKIWRDPPPGIQHLLFGDLTVVDRSRTVVCRF